MKKFIRLILLNTFSLFITSSFFVGLLVPNNLVDLISAGTIFTLINYLVKPIIKLFLLPINLITLGLFRWIANVLVLIVLTNIVSTVSIVSFTFPSISQGGFTTPEFYINKTVSYILTSFLLSLIFNLISTILKKD
ncbi:MAG: phage holin family protein [Candidatus Beckwithbacteria bacterium]|nr:phage holin family protein [Patescibacteria group bacterium]